MDMLTVTNRKLVLISIVDESFSKSTKQYADPGIFIHTEFLGLGVEKKNAILTLEECLPPANYREGNYIPLPSNVDFDRVVNNIIDSFKNDSNEKRRGDSEEAEKIKRGYDAWKKDLTSPENKYVISDAFWYMICKWHQNAEEVASEDEKDKDSTPKESPLQSMFRDDEERKRYFLEVENFLKDRMAKNYVNLFLSVNEKHKKSFFKV